MKEILDIVYDYSKKKQLLDNIAISKIVNVLLCQYQLSKETVDIRNKTHFRHIFDNTLAYHKKNEITIYLNKIYAYMCKKECFVQFDDDLSFYLRYNLFILSILFHEVYHAIEEKKIKDKVKDTETSLLTLEKEYITDIEYSRFDDGYSSKPDFDYRKELKNYKANYDISFFERMANIFAYKSSLDLIEPIKSEVNILYLFQEKLLYKAKTLTYKSPLDSPTYRFFTNIHKKDKFDQLDFSLLSPKERLDLGLDLQEEDYNSLILQKKRRN